MTTFDPYDSLMLRESLGLPPLYVCSYCSQEVDPNSSLVLRRVRGWTKNNKKTIAYLVEAEPVYAHETCVRYTEPEDSPTLF